MARYKATPEGNVPFTPEEEAEWDAKEGEWAAGANDRVAAEIRTERDAKLTDQAGFPNEVNWPTEP